MVCPQVPGQYHCAHPRFSWVREPLVDFHDRLLTFGPTVTVTPHMDTRLYRLTMIAHTGAPVAFAAHCYPPTQPTDIGRAGDRLQLLAALLGAVLQRRRHAHWQAPLPAGQVSVPVTKRMRLWLQPHALQPLQAVWEQPPGGTTPGLGPGALLKSLHRYWGACAAARSPQEAYQAVCAEVPDSLLLRWALQRVPLVQHWHSLRARAADSLGAAGVVEHLLGIGNHAHATPGLWWGGAAWAPETGHVLRWPAMGELAPDGGLHTPVVPFHYPRNLRRLIGEVCSDLRCAVRFSVFLCGAVSGAV